MASNDNSPRPSKKALIYSSVFGLVAIVLPWISFDVALNVLLLGTAMVLPRPRRTASGSRAIPSRTTRCWFRAASRH